MLKLHDTLIKIIIIITTTIIIIIEYISTAQLKACGLKTVGDQLRLKQMVDFETSSASSLPLPPGIVQRYRKKPTKDALKNVGDLDK